jgi:hypothetical protein
MGYPYTGGDQREVSQKGPHDIATIGKTLRAGERMANAVRLRWEREEHQHYLERCREDAVKP